MSDAHFASLSSTLLARKGGAKPAMRPQSAVLGPVDGVAAAANLEDLGWNDMGEDVAPMPEAPAPTMRQGGSASLAESGLIKKPALPPIEERDALADESGDTDAASDRVVPINSLQGKDQASQNEVRESLERIANRMEGKKPSALEEAGQRQKGRELPRDPSSQRCCSPKEHQCCMQAMSSATARAATTTPIAKTAR